MEELDIDFSTPVPPTGPNPAVEKKLALPPALLESLGTDPTAVHPLYRMMSAIGLREMWNRREGLTPMQKIQFYEILDRLGNPKSAQQQNTGPGATINIVLSKEPVDKPRSITIEQD